MCKLSLYHIIIQHVVFFFGFHMYFAKYSDFDLLLVVSLFARLYQGIIVTTFIHGYFACMVGHLALTEKVTSTTINGCCYLNTC